MLGHGWDNSSGAASLNKTNNGIPMDDVSAVNIENIVAQNIGVKYQRTTYDKKEIPKNLLNTYFTTKKK